MIDPPQKFSELLKLALDDLVKTEKDSRYQIEMDVWHRPDDQVCLVCFAGCVMAQTLESDAREGLTRFDFGYEWNCAFLALNAARCGWLGDALTHWGRTQLGPDIVGLPDYLEVPPYRSDPEGFKKVIGNIIELVKEAEA